MCVLASHYFVVYWTNPLAVGDLLQVPPAKPAVPAFTNWLTLSPHFDFGAFGVALFFLVSGFVIPFSLKNASFLSFLVARFFRIVPLYAVGFSISLATIWVVGRYFGVPWPFSAFEVLVHYFPGIRDLLWSRNIDGIIWTLDIEMKFYGICALAIVWFKRGSLWVFLVPVIVAAASSYMSGQLPAWAVSAPFAYRFGMGATFAAPFLVFMFIGTVFHFLHVGSLRGETALFLTALLFGMHAWLRMTGAFSAAFDLIWSYGAAVVVFAFAASFPRLFRSTRVGDFLADISFPLYVTHAVAGYSALRWLLEAGFAPWLSLSIVTAAALALAWLLHVTVELPSDRFGKAVARKMVAPLPPLPPLPAAQSAG